MADFSVNMNQPETAQLAALAEKPSAAKSISTALKKLSLRERVLIWALLILAAVMALIFFLVLPANDRLVEAQSVRDALINEENTTRLSIAGIPHNEELLEDAQARYAEYLLKYQAPMYPEDIDRMITTLIEDCGFTAATLSLQPYVTEGVPSYIGQALSWELPHPETTDTSAGGTVTGDSTGGADTANASSEGATADDPTTSGMDAAVTGTSSPDSTTDATGSASDTGADQGNANESAANALDATAGPEAQVFNVQITVVGTEDSYYALLDRVLPLSWLKISSVSYSPPSSTASTLDTNFVISLKIYVNAEATVKQP